MYTIHKYTKYKTVHNTSQNDNKLYKNKYKSVYNISQNDIKVHKHKYKSVYNISQNDNKLRGYTKYKQCTIQVKMTQIAQTQVHNSAQKQ